MRIARLALGLTLAASLTASVLAAPNWKTLTDAPRNTAGVGLDKQRPIEFHDSHGEVVIPIQDDNWVVNRAGAMGADKELFNEKLGARLGIWAGDSIKDKQPRNLVNEWVTNIKALTGGNWTTPKATTIAGIPVVQASGVDAYGNYYYRVVAFTRFGINYAFALRSDYDQRWNRDLDNQITLLATGCHISSAAYHKRTQFH